MYLQFCLNLDFQSIVVTLHVLFYCAGLHHLCLAFFTFIFFMISWLLFMCSFILLFSHLFGILCIYIFCFIIFSTENSLCLHELAVYEISNYLASDTTFHILDICNHSSENLIYLRGMNFLNSSCTLIICILKLSAEFKVIYQLYGTCSCVPFILFCLKLRHICHTQVPSPYP